MEGLLAGFDYKWGLSSSSSKASTNLLDGNMDEAKFKAAMDTGKINPFLMPGQTQTAEAQALINGAKAFGSLYGGKATLVQADGTISGEIYRLPAGPLSMAVGFDLRKESFRFKEDRSVQPAIIGVTAPPSLEQASRNVSAVLGEAIVPVVKDLEAQVAVRYDRYNDFGSTTNPKVGLRWAAAPVLVVRGSYSSGFHAPDFGALYAGEGTGQFTGVVPRRCGHLGLQDPAIDPHWRQPQPEA
jgi:iron complex outermembrane recepter protein